MKKTETKSAPAEVRPQLKLPPETLQQAIDAFLRLHTGQLAPSYREWCRQRLTSLIDSIDPDTPLVHIQTWHLDLWLSQLTDRQVLYQQHLHRETIHGRGLSPSTIHGYVRAVKTFFNWLLKRRFVPANPAAALQLPPLPQQPPKHATADEVKALLRRAGRQSHRNYAAIRLLIATGIRIGGMTRLQLADLNLEERSLLVREKGRGGSRKSRLVPMDPSTAKAIASYIRDRPPSSSDHLFLGRNRKPWSSTAVRQMMRRNSKNAGLSRAITPHMLRHYFGFESVRRGLPLRVIQQIMGHESSQTTEVYTRFSPAELREAYDQVYSDREETNGPAEPDQNICSKDS